MSIEGLRDELTAEVKAILSPDFTINVVETKYVPTVDDPQITYPNLRTMSQTCKLLTTCVLHVDIRGSVDLGDAHRRPTLAKLYSSFARGMARCAEYYNGKVRDIIGDRVTVFFDQENCFKNAVNTAILMNSFAKYVLAKQFSGSNIKCGIGIDYGPMLVAKVGIIKYGSENTSHKDLVWLGRPANVASRLADVANKTESWIDDMVTEFYHYPAINETGTMTLGLKAFVEQLRPTYSRYLWHPFDYFSSYWISPRTRTSTMPPILFTDAVYRGFKAAVPDDNSIKNNWWTKRTGISIPNVSVSVYGGDVHFRAFK